MPLGESFGRKVPLLVLNSADAALGYPFAGGKIEKVDITLR